MLIGSQFIVEGKRRKEESTTRWMDSVTEIMNDLKDKVRDRLLWRKSMSDLGILQPPGHIQPFDYLCLAHINRKLNRLNCQKYQRVLPERLEGG